MEKWEQNSLVSELVQGMELAKQLTCHMTSASSPETRELLVQRMLTSYERALLILNWNNGGAAATSATTATAGPTLANAPGSPLSISGSPWNDENSEEGLNKDRQEQRDQVSKKRKLMPTWTDRVRVNGESGLEGAHDDGYNWRKYGQKDILGAKYPRSYYRCTFRNTQKCFATKQVQRSVDDPSVFDITYRGKHTCQSPKSPENKQTNHQQETISNFRANLRVNTESDGQESEQPSFPFPPTAFGSSTDHCYYTPLSFLAPTTPETDYFSLLSANSSATNSPIMNFDFSLDHAEIDSYSIPGFFSY